MSTIDSKIEMARLGEKVARVEAGISNSAAKAEVARLEEKIDRNAKKVEKARQDANTARMLLKMDIIIFIKSFLLTVIILTGLLL